MIFIQPKKILEEREKKKKCIHREPKIISKSIINFRQLLLLIVLVTQLFTQILYQLLFFLRNCFNIAQQRARKCATVTQET